MIYLRRLNNNDLDYLMSIENDDSFWKYSLNTHSYSEEDFKSLINDSKLPAEITRQIRYVICRSANNDRLGFIDLFNIDFDKSSAGVGIIIPNKKDRNKGVGKKAISKLMKLCVEKFKIFKLYSNIEKNNTPSINCFKSVGFNEVNENSSSHIPSDSIDFDLITQFQCT